MLHFHASNILCDAIIKASYAYCSKIQLLLFMMMMMVTFTFDTHIINLLYKCKMSPV